MKSDSGFTLIETLIALAILGVVAVAILSGLTVATKATVIMDEQAIAESLVKSEIEYVKSCSYEYSVSEYPVDTVLTIPIGWSMSPPSVAPVHAIDDGIQVVTVAAEHNGRTMLSVNIYKVDR